MLKYFAKRPRSLVDSSSNPNTKLTPPTQPLATPTTQPPPHPEILLENQISEEEIVGDPGLRKPIEEYDANVRDSIRKAYIAKGPCQPRGHNFPRKEMGNDKRCFRKEWFKDRDWLEYSVSKDAAYCFYCYLFRPTNIAFGGDDVFMRTRFVNWKKAIQRFTEHIGGVGSAHNEARIQYEGFKNQRRSVEYSISSGKREMEVGYRKRLTAVLKVIRFLLRQGLAFRGHDESATSDNRGNFLELLEWYSSECPEVAAVIGVNAPGNNQMIAPIIQKQMVNACATETTNAILDDLGDRWFTLLLDEARDCSVIEQMAVVVRYVNKHGEVIERFLAIVHVATTTATCLKEAIDSLFAKLNLSVARLRGQGYDGASNMSGEFNGLKALILKENPYARYVHCFAHQLQLVVVSVAQENRYVCDFIWIVGAIVNTSASSCKRADQLRQLEHNKKIEQLERGEISSGRGLNQEIGLARPGDTRWGSHYAALCRIEDMWPSIVEVLENLIDDGDRSVKGLSRTLVEKMQRYEFVFILLLLKRILAITNKLSTVLQEKDQNIVNAMCLIKNVKGKLQKLRDSGWDELLEDVEIFCTTRSIEIVNMTETINNRSRSKRDGKNVTLYHCYHVEIFCEVIDIILQEMDNRFSETTTDFLICMASLDPKNSFEGFDVEKLLRLAHYYEDNFSWIESSLIKTELETYIDEVRSDERFQGIRDLGTLAKVMVRTKKNRVFPLSYRMIELALLLPVATATVERVFSAMNIVKSDHRNRIGDDWLNDCLTVYIEKDVFNAVDNEPILQRFQNMECRRMQLSRLPM